MNTHVQNKQLTERQQAVLNAIKEHVADHGWAPSMRKLGELVGIDANGVRGHLIALERKGYIERGDGAKEIRVIEQREAKKSA
jgi:repressor LexA